MASFLPPETAGLLPRLAARNARRARRLLARLDPETRRDREALRAFDSTLSHLRGDRRRDFLLDPSVRAWLCAAEEAVSLHLASGDPGKLFDLIAKGAHLAEVVPRGRLDAGFGRRAEALAARLTRRVFARLPSLARERGRIGGSGIVLAPARGQGGPGDPVPGLPRRLSRALDLLREVWEEAYHEVLAHTHVVIPLFEPAIVSYSQPDRPGVSFIRIPGKSLVDLADDLLHETAHHRLHALEELGPIERDDGEPRYYSAWRRSLRPLRGIFHATYTFSYRAQMLARLSSAPARLRPPLAWIRRQIEFERGALLRSLADLEDARSRGLLTTAGIRLLRALERREPWDPAG